MRLDNAKVIQITKLLCEGVGVRAAGRLVDCEPKTVLAVLNEVGEKCAAFLDSKVRNLTVGALQLDELWQFVGTKQANAGRDPESGDFYTFLALDARTKLIISHHTAKRDYANTDIFIADIASRIVGRVQITTDGWLPYPDTIRKYLLTRLDYAVMQKIYGESVQPASAARRYSPAPCTGVRIKVKAGAPRRDRISTSFVERANLSVRTFNRRFTRLCLGYSRKLENHLHSIALFVAAYNFCKVHKTLGCTPAVGSNLTDHNWSVEELLRNVSATI